MEVGVQQSQHPQYYGVWRTVVGQKCPVREIHWAGGGAPAQGGRAVQPQGDVRVPNVRPRDQNIGPWRGERKAWPPSPQFRLVNGIRYVGILKSLRTQAAQFSIPDEFGHLTLGDSLISSMCHGLYAILSYTLARIHTWTVTKDILRDECRAKCCRQNSCSPNMFKPTILLQLGFYVGWSCVLTLMERARYIFIYSSHYHAHKSIHIFMTRYLVLKLTNATSLCGIDLSSRDDIR